VARILRDGGESVSRRRRSSRYVLGALLLAVAVLTAACGGGSGPALVLEHNGLLADSAFDKAAPTSSLTSSFILGGTAGAKHAKVSLQSSGLYVHVDAHKQGIWKGYYATTARTFPANSVIQVRMYRPQRSVPLASESGITLLAVQTGPCCLLNYVLVAGVLDHGQEYWTVGHANGSGKDTGTKTLLDMPSAATSEDITLRTDGKSHYSVYFGDTLVYQSKSLKLGIAPPLRVYLEVEARGMAYVARFQHFSVASGTSVRIDGLHPGDRVSLAPKGDTTINAVANVKGEARLQLPLTAAVGKGTLTIDGPQSHRFKNVAFAGGDVYSFTS
jgi:hypothetical protein